MALIPQGRKVKNEEVVMNKKKIFIMTEAGEESHCSSEGHF